MFVQICKALASHSQFLPGQLLSLFTCALCNVNSSRAVVPFSSDCRAAGLILLMLLGARPLGAALKVFCLLQPAWHMFVNSLHHKLTCCQLQARIIASECSKHVHFRLTSDIHLFATYKISHL